MSQVHIHNGFASLALPICEIEQRSEARNGRLSRDQAKAPGLVGLGKKIGTLQKGKRFSVWQR
jgi:hypothetical protein